MSYSPEEMKALAAAMKAIPETEAEVSAFMADVDAGKYDELLAEAHPSPAELANQCVEKLKAEREKLRQDLESATTPPAEGETPDALCEKGVYCAKLVAAQVALEKLSELHKKSWTKDVQDHYEDLEARYGRDKVRWENERTALERANKGLARRVEELEVLLEKSQRKEN